MKQLIVIFLFSFLFLLTFNTTKAEDEIILFYSNTSEYCKEVIEVIEENDLENILNLKMMEENEEDFIEVFEASLESCEQNPNRGVYPTLYYNGQCAVGTSNVTNTLYTLADIELEEQDEKEIQEDMTTIQKNEGQRTLEEITQIEDTEKFEPEPRPFHHYLFMIIGPTILIWLGYFIIKKLNL